MNSNANIVHNVTVLINKTTRISGIRFSCSLSLICFEPLSLFIFFFRCFVLWPMFLHANCTHRNNEREKKKSSMFLQALYLVQFGNRHISTRHLDGRCYNLSGNESEKATHTEYTVIMSFLLLLLLCWVPSVLVHAHTTQTSFLFNFTNRTVRR